MSHVTLQGLVEARSADGDTLAVTWLFVALFAPQLVIGPFAGVLADRVERRRVVVACYSSAAVVAAALAAITYSSDTPPLAAIYGLALALGASFSFIGPSAGALIVNSVTPEDVPSAISMQAAVQNMTRVAGPILAAGIIAAQNFHIAFAAFAVATAIAAVLMSRVRVEAHDISTDSVSVFGQMALGFRHARERRPALLAIASVAVGSVFGVAHTALIPSFTREVLGEDAGRFGIIVAATGIGAIVGALNVGYSKREPSLTRGALSMVMYGVCLFGFAMSGTLIVAVAWQVVLGFFYFGTMTTLQTLVQQVVADEMRGRVMSLFGIAWGGLVWIGTLILGLAADQRGLDLGERPTLLLTASLLMVYGAVIAVVSRSMPTGSSYVD
ncbi:MAG: MFS family permease [Candidatus Aldehydirespiratoraceae bacterium]|jgi:MFS family permease